MSFYHQLISDATGVTDHAMLNDIEEIMRVDCGGTLDHLTKSEFHAKAKIAHDVARQLEAESREVG